MHEILEEGARNSEHKTLVMRRGGRYSKEILEIEDDDKDNEQNEESIHNTLGAGQEARSSEVLGARLSEQERILETRTEEDATDYEQIQEPMDNTLGLEQEARNFEQREDMHKNLEMRQGARHSEQILETEDDPTYYEQIEEDVHKPRGVGQETRNSKVLGARPSEQEREANHKILETRTQDDATEYEQNQEPMDNTLGAEQEAKNYEQVEDMYKNLETEEAATDPEQDGEHMQKKLEVGQEDWNSEQEEAAMNKNVRVRLSAKNSKQEEEAVNKTLQVGQGIKEVRLRTRNSQQEREVMHKTLVAEQGAIGDTLGAMHSKQEVEPMHEIREGGKKVVDMATPDSREEPMSNELEMPQESEHGVLQGEEGQRRVNHDGEHMHDRLKVKLGAENSKPEGEAVNKTLQVGEGIKEVR